MADQDRLYVDPDVIELERIEEQLMLSVRLGDYFEPESFDEAKISKPASNRIQKLLKRRDELIERVRPQCVPDDALVDEAMKAVEEQFGLNEDEWEQIDTDPGGA